MATPSLLESPTLKVPIELLRRIRAEYVEMPGLKLTTPQARRLWGLDGATCDAALAALVNAKFLSCTCEGLFVLATTPRPDQNLDRDSGTADAFDPGSGRQRSLVPSRGRPARSSGALPSRKSA